MKTEVVEARRAFCPGCKTSSPRHSLGKIRVKHITGRLVVRYSKHYCLRCYRYFVNPNRDRIIKLGYVCSNAFVRRAVAYARAGTLAVACGRMKEETGHYLADSTLHGWVNDEHWKNVEPWAGDPDGRDQLETVKEQ